MIGKTNRERTQWIRYNLSKITCSDDLRECILAVLDEIDRASATAGEPDPTDPIPMILYCPVCHERHLDEEEFATRPHSTHACQQCGFVWKPAKVATVGVRFLPGYRNE